MMSKKVLVPALIFALIGTGFAINTSYAQATNGSRQNELIQYLAKKLGVDQSKIQNAFDGYRSERQATHQKDMTEKLTTYLNGLVKEGKINDSQKTAILNKHSELQKARESTDWSAKTPQERKTALDKQRADLESWAKSQGIDISYLQFGLGGGRVGGRGMGMMKGNL